MSNERLYSENSHYVATIERQELCKTPEKFGSQPQLTLKVRLKGIANENGDLKLEKGFQEIPESLQVIRTIYLDLGADAKHLAKTKKILASLGFAFTDPKLMVKLHPSHPKFFNFAGKQLLVRVWYKPKDDGSVRETWYVVDDKPVETFDLKEFEELILANEEAYRNASD